MVLISDLDPPVLETEDILPRQAKAAPIPYFTDIALFNKPFDWAANGYRLGADGLPLNPTLAYNQNTITFHYSSIGFHNAPYFQFQYELEGLEGLGTGWQDGDETHKVAYNSLLPGDYTFRVRVANENGRWSDPISYQFTISPPWYRSWWAWTLWILLGAGAIITVFYLRQQSLKKKYRTEQELTEQKLIALRAQINPHFLQNTFNFLSQHIRYEPKETAIATTKKIAGFLRNVLHASDHSVVTLEKEIEFTDQYLLLQKTLFGDRIAYEIHVDAAVDTFDMDIPSMLLQPMVENAVKYGTRKGHHCFINITVTQDDHYIVCTIEDNGLHVDGTGNDPKHISKGIALTKGKLDVMFRKSAHPPVVTSGANEGQGYTAVIRIPLD